MSQITQRTEQRARVGHGRRGVGPCAGVCLHDGFAATARPFAVQAAAGRTKMNAGVGDDVRVT
jgi:hypothetical protein